jgi:hypothetical protein
MRLPSSISPPVGRFADALAEIDPARLDLGDEPAVELSEHNAPQHPRVHRERHSAVIGVQP